MARRRRQPGNKAIDGAICLEALLLGDGQGELTYRLRLRAAILLGDNLEKRNKISQDIKRFYNLRSDAVHGNTVDAHKLTQQHKDAAQGIEICWEALKAIVYLEKKYAPEWDLLGQIPR
jgi:Apea-like HEPN